MEYLCSCPCHQMENVGCTNCSEKRCDGMKADENGQVYIDEWGVQC